jgi:hypothetical protein
MSSVTQATISSGFIKELAQRVDSAAYACSSWARTYDESPPDSMYQNLLIHRDLWDAIQKDGNIDNVLNFFNTVYLPRYGYNVVWHLDDFLDTVFRTEDYKKLQETTPKFFVDDFEFKIGDTVRFTILNHDGVDAGSVTKTFSNYDFVDSFFVGDKMIFDPEIFGWNFNYTDPSIVTEASENVYDNTVEVKFEDVAYAGDVLVYVESDEVYELVYNPADYDGTDKDLRISDLITWKERYFWFSYSNDWNVGNLRIRRNK